jgi:hypothetical protein
MYVTMRMKYYIYISKTKVDMLYSQIPRNFVSKIGVELNIKIPFVDVEIKDKQPQMTLYDEVKLVTKYIDEHFDVGSIDNPKAYFKARLPMRWSIVEKKLVYFGGHTEETIFGLAGSTQHVIGMPRGDEGMSFAPMIETALEESMSLTPMIENALEKEDSPNIAEDHLLSLIRDETLAKKGPSEELEFLAKTLTEGSIDSSHILLGTPIYVASER